MAETYVFEMNGYLDFYRFFQLVEPVSTDASLMHVKLVGSRDLVSNVSVWSALAVFMAKHSMFWRVLRVEDNVVMHVRSYSSVHGPSTPLVHDVCVVLRAVGIEDL